MSSRAFAARIGGLSVSLAEQHVARLRSLGGPALRVVDKLPENYIFLGPLCLSSRGRSLSTAAASGATWRFRAG